MARRRDRPPARARRRRACTRTTRRRSTRTSPARVGLARGSSPRSRCGDDGRVALEALDAGARRSRRRRLRGGADPNFFGVVEDICRRSPSWRTRTGALLVVANTEPVAFGVLKSPGALGADIAVGEGLGLAIPPTIRRPRRRPVRRASASTLRQLPGRLVGETVDKDGRRGYVLTLATREQHIRREKATSNICTNQGLIALAFTIHMCLLGKRGLVEMAQLNLAKAEYAKSSIAQARRLLARVQRADVQRVRRARARRRRQRHAVEQLADQGIYAGVAATAPGMLPKGKGDDLADHRGHRAPLARPTSTRSARALDEVQRMSDKTTEDGHADRDAPAAPHVAADLRAGRARPLAARRCRRSTCRPSTRKALFGALARRRRRRACRR